MKRRRHVSNELIFAVGYLRFAWRERSDCIAAQRMKQIY
jgi:hypothetical protein